MVLKAKEISIVAIMQNSDLVVDFITDILDSIDCKVLIKNQILITVEELYANVAKYAYAGRIGMVTIRCALIPERQLMIIQFADAGKPFNPLLHDEPDIKAGLRERKVGGLGIFIAKKSVDKIMYHHKEGKNIVTLVKKIA